MTNGYGKISEWNFLCESVMFTREATMSQSSMPALRCILNRTHSLANTTKMVIGVKMAARMVVTIPLPAGFTKFGAGQEATTSKGGCGPPGIAMFRLDG